MGRMCRPGNDPEDYFQHLASQGLVEYQIDLAEKTDQFQRVEKAEQNGAIQPLR